MVGRHSKKARGQSRRYARKPSVWSEIRGYLLTVIAVMLVVLLGRTFVFNVYVIPSRSMEDTLQIGDRVFASRLTRDSLHCTVATSSCSKIPQTGWRGAASHQSDVDNRQQSLPNQTCHRSARRYRRLQGIREPITVNGKPIDESAYLKSGVNPSDSPFFRNRY